MTAILEASLTRRIHPGLRLDVSLSLGRECGVIFGPSGAGKTSLLRLIAGLDRADSGRVDVEGTTWTDSSRRVHRPLRSRRVGMIFQDDRLFPHLDVAANVRFGLHGWGRAEGDRRAAEVAGMCGIEALMGRRPATLSGGERQRVGLARALAPRPRLLLADEPVSALDLDSRHGLIEQLRRVPRDEGIPVLMVTHAPSEAIALGGPVFLMERGRIVDQGPPIDVLARHAGVSALDDIRNVLRGRVVSSEEAVIELDGGPRLIVPRGDLAEGARVTVAIRGDEIVLARGEIAGLSARNLIAGAVARILPHAGGAEVVVKTGEVEWIVSVVASAVASLQLEAGSHVSMIIKARSCRVQAIHAHSH